MKCTSRSNSRAVKSSGAPSHVASRRSSDTESGPTSSARSTWRADHSGARRNSARVRLTSSIMP